MHIKFRTCEGTSYQVLFTILWAIRIENISLIVVFFYKIVKSRILVYITLLEGYVIYINVNKGRYICFFIFVNLIIYFYFVYICWHGCVDFIQTWGVSTIRSHIKVFYDAITGSFIKLFSITSTNYFDFKYCCLISNGTRK